MKKPMSIEDIARVTEHISALTDKQKEKDMIYLAWEEQKRAEIFYVVEFKRRIALQDELEKYKEEKKKISLILKRLKQFI